MKAVKENLEKLDDNDEQHDDDVKNFLLNVCSLNSNEAIKEVQTVWQANTDIQICLDTYAVISYISDYMTKSDQNITKYLVAALNEKKNASKFEQLNHVKRTYFTHKQTSVSEAAYRLIPGLNLKDSNIKTLFLTSGFPNNRRRVSSIFA